MSAIDQTSEQEKEERSDSLCIGSIPLQIWGPVSLLCTFALAAGTSMPLDLLFVALAGLYLCARWQMRGCAYALILLCIGGAIKHCFLSSQHLWHLGLEASIGSAFFITAYAFQQALIRIDSLTAQVETREASLQNLEEELSKDRENSLTQQIALQEKIASLQKELEEIQTDHSSLLILNEVLRQSSARSAQENSALSEISLDQKYRIALLQQQLEASEKELLRVKSSDELAIANRLLMKELNAARYEKEQTHLINETLVRLHAKENLKAVETARQADVLAQDKKQLEELLSAARAEAKMLSAHQEQSALEADKARTALKGLIEIQTQKNFLQERLQVAEAEIAHLQQKAAVPQRNMQLEEAMQKERDFLSEQLAQAQAQVHALSKIEPLYNQLKKQFEEKNQILHQTRSELFKLDTELQKIKMEQAQASLQADLVPREVTEEIDALDQALLQLEEENIELEELVTFLTDQNPSDSAPKRKKKVKIASPDQNLLF